MIHDDELDVLRYGLDYTVPICHELKDINPNVTEDDWRAIGKDFAYVFDILSSSFKNVAISWRGFMNVSINTNYNDKHDKKNNKRLHRIKRNTIKHRGGV